MWECCRLRRQGPGDGRGAPTPHAEDLFARCFSLSNAPEMRLVANEEIVAQLLTLGAW